MDLSLTEASAVLGKTERQIRYLIKSGRIQARKSGGRWIVDGTALPGGPESERAVVERAGELSAAVEAGLAPTEAAASKVAGQRKAYSVREMCAVSRERIDTLPETLGRVRRRVRALVRAGDAEALRRTVSSYRGLVGLGAVRGWSDIGGDIEGAE